jgi:hypothetical protein
LSEVVDAMDLAPESAASYVNRETGRVEVLMDEGIVGEDDEEQAAVRAAIEADEGGRFVALPERIEIDELGMMRRFAAGVGDWAKRRALNRALSERRPFRAFKDKVRELGLEDGWYADRDQAYRRLAIEWCKANNLTYDDDASGWAR